MTKTDKIREILKRFKDFCKTQGWAISEKDDWVKTEGGYHNFVWVRSIHPSSFKRITANGKCVVREGSSYRVAEASYTAWLFCEAPAKNLLETVYENSQFSTRTAMYNFSPFLEGKDLVYKLNDTDSLVLKNFERFLREELKVKLKPILESETISRKHAVAKIA